MGNERLHLGLKRPLPQHEDAAGAAAASGEGDRLNEQQRVLGLVEPAGEGDELWIPLTRGCLGAVFGEACGIRDGPPARLAQSMAGVERGADAVGLAVDDGSSPGSAPEEPTIEILERGIDALVHCRHVRRPERRTGQPDMNDRVRIALDVTPDRPQAQRCDAAADNGES